MITPLSAGVMSRGMTALIMSSSAGIDVALIMKPTRNRKKPT